MEYAATKRTTVLRTTKERAGPEVMGTDVRNLRVGSTCVKGRVVKKIGDFHNGRLVGVG
jgi:hypothetical protein